VKRLRSSGAIVVIDPSGSVDVLAQITDVLEGIQGDLSQVITEYNKEVYSVISSLPQGKAETRWSLTTDDINPRINNFDGDNIFVDTLASSTKDGGRFWLSTTSPNRPKTVRESFLNVYTTLTTSIDQLRAEIAAIGDANPVKVYNTSAAAGNLIESDAQSIIFDGTTLVASSGGTNVVNVTASGVTNAIHDDESGEIQAVTAKASPVSADVLLIEDSASSYAKKRVTVENLFAGRGISIFFNPIDYGAAGDGVTDDTSALNSTILAIQAAGGGILYIPNTANILVTSITIPIEAELWIVKGGMITVSTGQTVTLQGELSAGRYQIFTLNGTGVVEFENGTTVCYPEWWGAVRDYNPSTGIGTDCKAAFDDAVVSGVPISLAAGYNARYYRYHGKMTLDRDNSYLKISGVSRWLSRIYFTDSTQRAGIESWGTTYNEVAVNDFHLNEVGIYGPGSTTGSMRGIYLGNELGAAADVQYIARLNFKGIHFEGWSDEALFIPALFNSTLKEISSNDCGSSTAHIVLGKCSPSVLLEQFDWLSQAADTSAAALWIMDGDPVMHNINIGYCDEGVIFGRLPGDLAVPFDDQAYAYPTVDELNIEPCSTNGVRFQIGSAPRRFANVTIYADDGATIQGVVFDYLVWTVVMERIGFAAYGTGTYSNKIVISGADSTNSGLEYWGPSTDLAVSGTTARVTVRREINRTVANAPGRHMIHGALGLPDGSSGIVGEQTWSGTASAVNVTCYTVTANSRIFLEPTNQSCAQLFINQRPYVSAIVAGGQFTVTTADGLTKPSASDTFNWFIIN
jgi:hypothetical protein